MGPIEEAEMPTASELTDFIGRLAGSMPESTDSDRIDLLTALEALKGAAAAAQARVTVAFDASQQAAQSLQGVPPSELGKGVASQVALARHDSPVKGGRHLGLARALVQEMPYTLRALAAGRISEWRATIMVRETAVLSAEHRARVDSELAGRLPGLGDGGVAREARKIAYRLDPGSVMRRVRRAEADRRVTTRPAPDTMSYVTGLLPVAQGVAVHAALTRHADSLRAAGDPRSRGQIMADTFVERLTGQTQADAVSTEIQLVMTDKALFGSDDTPAQLTGYGPVPAALARALVRGDDTAARPRAWIRRLYTSPTTGDLVAMDSTRRIFPEGLRTFLVVRDGVCRTPWCDAPIRHSDHVVPHAAGGPTSAANGQGLCERCNHAKESPGWSSSTTSNGSRAPVTVRTPTGHTYTSTAPDPPGQIPLRARLRQPAPGVFALDTIAS
jgi:5-methylcytosine-specific restriction endonuclease McrA